MLTKEQKEQLNPKSLWIPFTEDTDWDAIDFDDMFVLCSVDEEYIQLYNGRASIFYHQPLHPASVDNEDNDHTFFAYQEDDRGVYHLKLTEEGKKWFLENYLGILPLNFNVYVTFRKHLVSGVHPDSVLRRNPLLLLYDNGYIDVLPWQAYSSSFDEEGKEHFSFPDERMITQYMNNVTRDLQPGDGLDEIGLEFSLDMNKCPLTRLFD